MFLFILNKIELKIILMNENLYNMFDDILVSDFNIRDEGIKKVVELGKNAEYGKMETYSIFELECNYYFCAFFFI